MIIEKVGDSSGQFKLDPLDEAISILIVDDVAMNRNLLRRRIQKKIAPNCIITEASTGEEALRLTETGDTVFDVIIVDQYMDRAGGILVGTQVIAKMRQSKLDSFIIGCSGNDLDSMFHEAGVDLVWKKPMPNDAQIASQFRTAMERRSA